MIEPTRGNILTDDAEALVNTVNCVGVMGKGIALQFKKAFPENFNAYQAACRHKEVRPGSMFVYKTGQIFNPRFIINFPTKRHWREKSRYEDIENGLQALLQEVRRHNIRSIAIPPLGAGLGGLQWDRVRGMIESVFTDLVDISVRLYEPKGSPDAHDMPVGTVMPRMTVARALLIKLMNQYDRFAYRLTLLEIQKLAYFLQESGMDLKLRYVKHLYGPYAHNLNKVLEILEGHHIRGYGDTQKPDVEISLLPEANKAADHLLQQESHAAVYLEKVSDLVDGFETPYGMELLASVHWAAVHDGTAIDAETAAFAMACWNDRKCRLFRPEHIRLAWDRLQIRGWVKTPPGDESIQPGNLSPS
jgi:O-acetyl-ADP-ribose deacetylase (regulator of RNase III)